MSQEEEETSLVVKQEDINFNNIIIKGVVNYNGNEDHFIPEITEKESGCER